MAWLANYFDEDEFEASPIKYNIDLTFLNSKMNQSYGILMDIQKTYVHLQDHWLSSSLDNQDNFFFKLIIGPSIVGAIKPNVEDMLMVMFANDNEEIHITRTRLTLIDIMATAGGFASILLLVSRNFSQYYGTLLFKEKLITHLCKISSGLTPKAVSPRKTSKSAPSGLVAFLQGLTRPSIKPVKLQLASCCSWIQCRKPPEKSRITFANGLEAVDRDIDFLRLVKTVKKLRVLLRVMLKDYQRPLFKFAAMSVISQKSLGPSHRRAKTNRSLEKSLRRAMRSEKEANQRLVEILEGKKKEEEEEVAMIGTTLYAEKSRGSSMNQP